MQKTERKTASFDKKYGSCAFIYVIEAMLEYFVALSVADVYLAKIASAVGMSDQATAVLASFVSLGCGFQFLSLFFFRSDRVKKKVTAGHIVSQTCFTLAYFVPLAAFSGQVKTVILVAALLVAQLLHNLVNAPKINWYMSMIRDEKRGSFTAVKEIVSLFGGMAFTYLLAFCFDSFSDAGNQAGAFVCGAVILAVVTTAHTVALLLTKEKPTYGEGGIPDEKPQKTDLKALFRNKSLWKIVLIASLWYAANYATLSFSGTYRINELGFSMTYSAVIIAVGSVMRALVSVPLGKFGDKKGFGTLISFCFLIAAAGYVVYAFTSPENGKILYPVYYVLYCIAMAGINGSMINLVYDYVPRDMRSGALAVQHSVSGIVGFLTTLSLTPLMTSIKAGGNVVMGMTVYSQQLFALISLEIVLFLAFYSAVALGKRKNRPSDGNNLQDDDGKKRKKA